MQKWQYRSSTKIFDRHALQRQHHCHRYVAARHFHAQLSLLQDEMDNSRNPQMNPNTRRHGAQIAGRLIQGLRGAAPGGFREGSNRRQPAQSGGPSSTGPSASQVMIRKTASSSRERSQETVSKGTRLINKAYGQAHAVVNQDSESSGPTALRRSSRRRVGKSSREYRDRAEMDMEDEYDDDYDEDIEDSKESREFEDKGEDDVDQEAAFEQAVQAWEDETLRPIKQEEQKLYAHLDWADQIARGHPKAFKPPTYKTADLVTNRTSTIVGTHGAKAELEVAMSNLSRRDDISWGHDEPLARGLIAGKLVRFRDEEERARVLRLAEDFAARTANFIQAKKGAYVEKEDVGFVAIPKRYQKMLANRAIAGHYSTVEGITGSSQEERTMSHLINSLQLNSTYSPAQANALSEFVQRMWSGQKTQGRN